MRPFNAVIKWLPGWYSGCAGPEYKSMLNEWFESKIQSTVADIWWPRVGCKVSFSGLKFDYRLLN